VADAEERNRRQELRDRSFELQKHVSTLSTAASLLILAVYRERPFEVDSLVATLVLLALSAVIAVYGMTVITLDEHRPSRYRYRPDPESVDRHIYWVANAAPILFIAAVVGFAPYLFDVPFWIAIPVLWVVITTLQWVRTS
jgi:amino acid transporter